MTGLTELELKTMELELRRQELDLQRTKLFIEFARFGFVGTLTGGLVGMALVLALASLNAFTTFKIETWALVGIMFIVLLAVISFGFLSLWELPRIVARFQKMQLSVNAERNDK